MGQEAPAAIYDCFAETSNATETDSIDDFPPTILQDSFPNDALTSLRTGEGVFALGRLTTKDRHLGDPFVDNALFRMRTAGKMSDFNRFKADKPQNLAFELPM